MCCTVVSNEDEGIDVDDHGAVGLASADNLISVDDDFSDAGRYVSSSSHNAECSVMRLTHWCLYILYSDM